MGLRNYTIDDSEWSTATLSLSPGWNMLRNGGSNEYLDEAQVEAMQPLLGGFWNESISWTSEAGASSTLTFIGTDIWAYGIAGPDQGTYDVSLDNATVSSFNAHADEPKFQALLYEAHDLEEGVVHHLKFINTANISFAFDYSVVQTGQDSFELPPYVNPTATPAAISSTTVEVSPTPPSLSSATLPIPSTVPARATSSSGPKPANLASQQSLLSTPYIFHWNPAVYFVVVFSALLVLVSFVFLAYYFHRRSAPTHQTSSPQPKRLSDAEWDMIERGRPKPSQKVMFNLKQGNISSPIPSEDGRSHGPGSRGSDGSMD